MERETRARLGGFAATLCAISNEFQMSPHNLSPLLHYGDPHALFPLVTRSEMGRVKKPHFTLLGRESGERTATMEAAIDMRSDTVTKPTEAMRAVRAQRAREREREEERPRTERERD